MAVSHISRHFATFARHVNQLQLHTGSEVLVLTAFGREDMSV